MGFFLTIFYLVVLYVRPQDFMAGLKGFPLMDVVAVLCVCGVFLEGAFKAEKFKRSVLNKFVLAFWVVIPITNAVNGWIGGGLKHFVSFASVAVLYLLIIICVDSFKRLKLFIWVMIILACLLSIQAIVQFYTGEGLFGGHAFMRAVGEEGEKVAQAQGIGIFADPNDLGINLVVWVPFLLPAFHKPFFSRSIITGWFFLLFLVTGLVYTRSRGAILGLAMVAWYYFYRRVGAILSVGGLLLLLVLLFAIPRMGDISTEKGSGRSRLEHWSHGMSLLRENPVFGVGMNMFTETHHLTAHNTFVLAVAEMGLIGGFIWVTMWFAAFREIYLLHGLERAPPFLEPLLNALTAALIGWQTSAFFLSHTYRYTGFVLLALVVATMNSLANEGFTVRHPWGARQMIYGLGLTMGAVLFMYMALRVMWHL